MRTLIFKNTESLWPTVTWEGSRLVVFLLGEEVDDVSIKEAKEIDIEELLLHLDRGGSIFLTMKPKQECNTEEPDNRSRFSRAVRKMLPSFMTQFVNPQEG